MRSTDRCFALEDNEINPFASDGFSAATKQCARKVVSGRVYDSLQTELLRRCFSKKQTFLKTEYL